MAKPTTTKSVETTTQETTEAPAETTKAPQETVEGASAPAIQPGDSEPAGGTPR